MTPERWQQIVPLFDEALELEPRQRAAFLAAACAEDEGLRREVETLLGARDRAGEFLQRDAIEITAARLAAERMAIPSGQIIGHFEVLAPLGAGAMGEVYLARDTRLERQVALKLLPARFTQDAPRLRRFEREARAASALNHPNIITVYETGTDGAHHFIATEFVAGMTLRQRLADGPLPLTEAVAIAAQIADALEAAHDAGIVHRDIKPENVMLRPDGLIKVLDFGIAKLIPPNAPDQGARNRSTEQGTVIGTPGYMSPEQTRGLDVEAHTDIFSLGVLLYEMVAGQPPFRGATKADVFAAVLTAEPPSLRTIRLETPVELQQLVGQALRKQPEERQQSSGVLLAALRALQKRYAQEPPQPPPVEEELSPLLSEFAGAPRLRAWLRRDPGGVWLALAFCATALVTALLSYWVGAACISITLQTNCANDTPTVTFGYLAELNAGPLYLVGAPLFMIVGFHLLELAHGVLRRLVAGRRLVTTERAAGTTPLQVIAARNRWLSRRLLLLFVLFALAEVGIPEYVWRHQLALGWVQALQARDLRGVKLTQLQEQQAIGDLPALQRLTKGRTDCTVEVGAVCGGHGQDDRLQWQTPFVIFVALAFGLQMIFIVFALWLTTKIIFLFVMLMQALVERPRQTLKLTLDFADERRRFGLGVLDTIHNTLVALALIGSFVVVLSHLTNVAKGTSFFGGVADWSLIGQGLLYLSALMALLLALFVPAHVFVRLLATAVGRHLEKLDGKEAELRETLHGAELKAALNALDGQRALAQEQRPWPRANRLHRGLLLASIVLLFALPLGVEYAGLLQRSDLLLDLPRAWCRFC